MKNKQTLLIFIISLLSLNLISQTWQKTYRDGNSDDYGHAICKTLDSCYLIAGHADFNIAMLYKIDRTGNLLWSRSYNPGTNFSTSFYSVIENPDSTILVSGAFSFPFHGGTYKLSKNGSLMFALKNTGSKLYKMQNNDILTFGYYSPNSRISTNGISVWEKDYYNTIINSVAQLNDGNLICIGSGNYCALSNHLALMKLNTNGDTLWIRQRGCSGGPVGKSVYSVNSGGFMFTDGNSIFKCDNNGTVLFEKNMNYSVTISKIIDALDGGSYVGGTINGQGSGGDDFFLMKIDGAGNTLWTKAYGSLLNEQLSDIILGFNNSIILVGNTNGFSSINNDIFVVTTDLNGNTACNQTTCTLPIVTNTAFQFQRVSNIPLTTQNTISSYTIINNSNSPATNTVCSGVGINELNNEKYELTTYPNPVKDNLTVIFNSTNDSENIEVYDINGACVLTEKIRSNFGSTKVNVNISKLTSGIYFVRLGTLNTKVVVE